jgi:predicted  nucleic acid-binding Zn-ribbon protein
MREEIEALLVLQDRDQKIRTLQLQQKSLPKDKKALEDKLAGARAALEAAKLRQRENEVERRKLELEVQAKRAAIVRFKTQQQQTRKNEEFQAFNHEIAHFEKDIAALEDRELEFMEQAEAFQSQTAAAEKELARAQASVQEQIVRLETGAQAGAVRLRELEADHARLGAGVSEGALELYKRLFAKKGDSAVVPLENEVCGGCHMKVPAQVGAQVRAEQGITQCPQCGRILHRVR